MQVGGNGVDAWSYSRYDMYQQCPQKFKFSVIDKLATPPSDAMDRGRQIHKLAEKHLLNPDPAAPTPPELNLFTPLFDWLRTSNLNLMVEQQWAFTKDWRVTGWFAKSPPMNKAWYRGVVDAAVNYGDGEMLLIDHKTGKMYDTNEDQIELFAMTGFLRFPDVKKVEARLWYLDSGDEVVRNYSRDNLPAQITKWETAIGPMFNDTIFAPRPNNLCKYCPFSRTQGGPCKAA